MNNLLFDTKIGDTKTIDGMVIGGTTPVAGTFTALSATTISASGQITAGSIATAIPSIVYNAVSTAPTANVLQLTGANITGATGLVVLNLTNGLGAGAQATLPTVAALATAMATASLPIVAGWSYELNVYNSSSGNYAWTVATATGWTLTGTMTIAQNTFRKYAVTFTTATAAVLQSLGEFTITSGI